MKEQSPRAPSPSQPLLTTARPIHRGRNACSPIDVRLFFDCSPILNRRTIEEQSENNRRTDGPDIALTPYYIMTQALGNIAYTQHAANQPFARQAGGFGPSTGRQKKRAPQRRGPMVQAFERLVVLTLLSGLPRPQAQPRPSCRASGGWSWTSWWQPPSACSRCSRPAR